MPSLSLLKTRSGSSLSSALTFPNAPSWAGADPHLPRIDGAKDDTTVAEKLLHREEEAHHSLGTAEGITREFTARKEEDRLVKDLLAGQDRGRLSSSTRRTRLMTFSLTCSPGWATSQAPPAAPRRRAGTVHLNRGVRA